jgi:hypothetical protein
VREKILAASPANRVTSIQRPLPTGELRALDSLLRSVYLFKELAPAELTAVARICASKTLKPGDKIFPKEIGPRLYT